MLISLIVAVAENGVIGRDGDLPWRMSSDLKTFRRITMGKPIIMGRKTFETLPKALDGRTNIVVTRRRDLKAQGAVVVGSVDEALQVARAAVGKGDGRHVVGGESNTHGEAVIIGGAEIYALTLPMADRIYFTEIHGEPKGDTTFPKLDPEIWREVSATPIETGPRDDYPATLRIFERRSG